MDEIEKKARELLAAQVGHDLSWNLSGTVSMDAAISAIVAALLAAQQQGEEPDRLPPTDPQGEALSEAEQVCAQAYQVVGSLLDDLGQFDSEMGNKILDNLAEARMVHDDVLPWPSFAPESQQAKEVDILAAMLHEGVPSSVASRVLVILAEKWSGADSKEQ